MNKTEAAQTIATHVRVWARQTDQPITIWMCVEIVSEKRHANYSGTYAYDAAHLANPRTVYRLATRHSL